MTNRSVTAEPAVTHSRPRQADEGSGSSCAVPFWKHPKVLAAESRADGRRAFGCYGRLARRTSIHSSWDTNSLLALCLFPNRRENVGVPTVLHHHREKPESNSSRSVESKR